MSEQTAKQSPHTYQRFLQRLPKDWDRKEIRQLGTVVGGGTPSRDVPSFWRGAIPWVTPGEVSGNVPKFLRGTNEFISAAGLAGSGANLLPVGSLMVTTRATLGARAINAVPMATNQGFKSIVFKQAADADFYIHFFEKVQPELVRRASGTTFLEISGTEFAGIEVPSPSLDEKRLISEILDTLDTVVYETEAIIGKLKAVKQGLLQDLLTRGIDTSGALRPPRTEAPHLYKESPLGWIPKDWEAKQILELLAAVDPAMRSGPFGSALLKQELVSEGIPFLGIDNVHAERFVADYRRFVTHKKFSELARYAVRPNDLLITIMGTVGRSCLVPEHVGPALSSKHIWAITLNQALYSPYLAMLQINYSPWVLKHFGKDQQGGTMAAIRSETLRSTLLPTPPREEQRLMEERLRVISRRIDLEVDSLVKMQAKKSGLMDDLLTGQVRVTNILAPRAGTSHTDPHALFLELCRALYQADQRAKDEYKRELFGDAFVPELLVIREDKVRVEIRKENVSHNAPHLHISHSDKFDASISLKDFSVLAGDIDRKVLKHFVKKLAPLKVQLMQIWNELNDKENSAGAEILIRNLKL